MSRPLDLCRCRRPASQPWPLESPKPETPYLLNSWQFRTEHRGQRPTVVVDRLVSTQGPYRTIQGIRVGWFSFCFFFDAFLFFFWSLLRVGLLRFPPLVWVRLFFYWFIFVFFLIPWIIFVFWCIFIFFDPLPSTDPQNPMCVWSRPDS